MTILSVPRLAKRTSTELGWWPVRIDGWVCSAWMVCRNGHRASLVDHDIAPDGMVRPSVVCPVEGCGFHEHVRLAGWTDVPVEG